MRGRAGQDNFLGASGTKTFTGTRRRSLFLLTLQGVRSVK